MPGDVFYCTAFDYGGNIEMVLCLVVTTSIT